MGGTPISLRQKLRMQRERMQCAGLWPVVLNVLNNERLLPYAVPLFFMEDLHALIRYETALLSLYPARITAGESVCVYFFH